MYFFCSLSLICLCKAVSGMGTTSPISVSKAPPATASGPIPEAFLSYSIEYSFFPDFAGNLSKPNAFSNTLLDNIKSLQGTKPIIRVGGSTQDRYFFSSTQKEGIINVFDSPKKDQPSQITIGDAFFESFSTWPDTKFIYGFNLGSTGSKASASLYTTAQAACKALQGDKLAYWELGNEPDLYKNYGTRAKNYTEQDYVDEWLDGTRRIKTAMSKACPCAVTQSKFKFIAPSTLGSESNFSPVTAWQSGLTVDADIAFFGSHNYMGSSLTPGLTLQGNLMNHGKIKSSIGNKQKEMDAAKASSIPYALTEINSLASQGLAQLSSSFGAALWSIDYCLWAAFKGIQRIHLHQGTGYRYASWQPLTTAKGTKGTKAPYYGNIAVAAFLGDLTSGTVRITNLPVPGPNWEAAYAAYVNGVLARILIVNMREYNSTANGPRKQANSANYSFVLPSGLKKNISVRRLLAAGSDVLSGITYDGYSYNWELNEGRPVLLGNVTRGEELAPDTAGKVTVNLPDSSVAILNLSY